MKYIRTNKGIYEEERLGIHDHGRVCVTGTGRWEKFIKQADTIEELVDGYIRVFIKKSKDVMPIVLSDGNAKTLMSCEHEDYGAIWISLPNGSSRLEPVAKKNGKGKFELL